MVEIPPSPSQSFPESPSHSMEITCMSTGDHIAINVERLSKGDMSQEDMKCEHLRVNTFKGYRGHATPGALAKAGFYLDPNSGETVCRWCGLKFEPSHWCRGRNPYVEHKSRSPSCVYIRGLAEDNIPFQTKAQRINKEPYLPSWVNSATNQESSSSGGGAGRLVTDFGGSTGDSARSAPSPQVSAPVSQESSNSYRIQSRGQLTPAPNNRANPEVVQSMPEPGNPTLYQPQQARSEPPFQSLPVFQQHQQQGANPGSHGSVEQDHPNQVVRSASSSGTDTHTAPSAPVSLGYPSQGQSRNFSAPASLPFSGMNNRLNSPSYNSRTNSMTNSDGDGADPMQRMKSEQARLRTYTRWPNRVAVAPEDLARAGFFYTGSTDRVQCAFCENVLRNWEPGDNPSFEHRRHFPRCRFVLGQDVGNIPIPDEQRQRAEEGRGVGMQPASAAARQPAAPAAPPAPARPAGVNALGMMGVNTELPKHPEYAIEASRLLTYRTWRVDMAQPADVLCRAGFFYTGQDDNVRCFFCDGGLRNWEREDDPFTEHARWFPRCAFIREVRGEDFVNSMATRYPRVVNMPSVPAVERPAAPAVTVPAPAPAPTRPVHRPVTRQPPGGSSSTSSGYHTASNSGSSGGSVPGVQYRVEEREVKARMDTPAVRAVLDMGFDRTIVLAAIRKQLRQRGEDFASAEMLLEALFDEEDLMLREEEELEPMDVTPAPAAPTPAPVPTPAPTQGTNQGSEARMQPGGGQPAVPPVPSAENTPAPPGGAGSVAVPSDPSPALPQQGATSASTGNITGVTTPNNPEGATGGNSDANNSTGGATSTKKRRKPKKKVGNKTETRTPPPEGAEDSGVASSGNPKHNTETKTLLEENRQLKDQRMCKVCMDAEANIVFLPCGHLVCCANCAPALRNCAVCRSLIRGTVRTYLS